MPKKWTNKKWGNLLILLGLLVLLFVLVNNQQIFSIAVTTPIASVSADGISEANTIGLFIGFGLILVGAVLRFKK